MTVGATLLLLLCIKLCWSLNRSLLEHSEAAHKVRLPWCPPANFVEQRKRRGNTRMVFISEIHGEITPSRWGTFMNGNLLARNFHHHLGVMGFDKMYLNVIYNDTFHTTPPPLDLIYPPETSCVSAWFRAGVVEPRYIPYAGPESRWPLKNGKPSLEKDLYKTLRGINPAYAEIQRRQEADWVMVLDIDEYLWPVGWKPEAADWCSSKFPTVMQLALQQMQVVATTVNLEDFPLMIANQKNVRAPADACMLGYGVSRAHGRAPCQPIASIIMPVRFWTKLRTEDGAGHVKTNHMPQLRSRVFASYDIVPQLNRTVEDEENQYNRWKAIHNTQRTPLLEGDRSMHLGPGDLFSVLAPREYHRGLTLEVAHVKRACAPDCLSVLMRDDVLDELARGYAKCMRSLK